MPFYVILAAAAVAAAVPLMWWSVASARAPGEGASANLARGLGADFRALELSASASDRALKPAILWFAGLARRLTPLGMLARLQRKLVLAGRPPSWPVERVLAAKILVGSAGLLLGVLLFLSDPSRVRFVFGLLLAILWFYLPDVFIALRGQARQNMVRLRMADTLDQMTVCMEAGLGFEAAMARVGHTGSGPLADEFIRTLQEMQIGSTRAQALRALADRTDVPELRRFVLAMLQAEAHGLPLGEVLRIQASELRVKRRQYAEERAMKIPVKLVFPLIACILPTLFLVVLGPAAIRMLRFFAGGTP